ncbi:MAG TPA: tetratricopeptide repeat protein [Pyrinomonadaceae bacterium]|jgi:tetratricopeptide (TPR) repeat protein
MIVDKAFSMIRECKQVFADHGDTRMVFIAGITEGTLLHRLAKYREARETYLLLVVSGKPDVESEAALRKNIGLCCIELGDFAEAEATLKDSAALYTKLGHPIEVLGAQAGYGRLLIRMGKIEPAIEHLKPIRRAFLRQAMPEEAGICAFEINRRTHDPEQTRRRGEAGPAGHRRILPGKAQQGGDHRPRLPFSSPGDEAGIGTSILRVIRRQWRHSAAAGAAAERARKLS